MVLQPYLFFSDIYFLNIVYKFLFKPVAIVVFLAHIFFQQAGDAISYLLFAKWFQFDHFILLGNNIADTQAEIFFQ